MSAGWGRFQDEGAGPDWLAAEGESDGAPGWAAPGSGTGEDNTGAGSQGEPGWGARSTDASAAKSGAGSGQGEPSASDDGAPGWAAPAEPGTDSAPSGWASLGDSSGGRGAVPKPSKRSEPSKQSERGDSARSGQRRDFGEDRRGGSASASSASASASAKKSAAKKTSGGWSSRRKDRDPADADKPKPQLSREKLEQRAKNILMYHLGRQMQTRSQLADRLRKKEIPDDIAEAALDRFEELHLLNDTDYAEVFVRSRHNERGLAKRALGYELRKRGIDDETAAEALSTLDEDQEAATARRLVDSRLRGTRGLDPQVRTRRLVGMLARKGYSSSIAFRVVKEALAEEGLDVDLGDPGFD
ncbi:regulatory protein RecX [Catenulispora acidiphila DSM 44928]|uniref:Regulatory protein RecX n=1 Tax=Catenulispora acidiphila (strain DSM 44928 / JCM 14897 / NBRC 102108 / NRRL B-24433 / ID139908) TaxID=479433 RepID=C7QAA5_CATAD|nr:regulatory protein RecX [Catenulispora acidiphila]ACU70503.1 regulatory protein RecX [Catenulispora acidiphila DSM 44928]